ncbi:MAG: hypothetical protein QOG80_3433, partial [Pseudonocardiales bacterium]|nr:hypothetical protein [Pseudonocardiales bacterium]
TGRSNAASPDAVASGLADALRVALPVDRGGVWLIRRLGVHAAVASGTGARAIAESLAAELVRELERTLAAGPTDADVRWFPDRAAFLEQWLVDLHSGQARGRWEYRGLGDDSAAAAIRLRAQAEPEQLLEALRRLPAADLDEIIARLAPTDATALAHALASGPDSAAVAELAATAASLSDTGRLPREPRRATLLVLVAHGGALGPADAALARDLTLALSELRSCPAGERGALLAALGDGDWAAMARLGASTSAAALAGWPAAARAAAVHEMHRARATPDAPPAERGYTRFGGQFLLLPLLAELPLVASTAGWPAFDGTSPHVGLGALAVVGVLGSELVLADPFFRLGAGLPECALADLARWTGDVGVARLEQLGSALDELLQRRADGVRADLADPELLIPGLPPEAASAVRTVSAALLREFACRLPGMATASIAHLRRNVLALDAHVTIDEQRVVAELGHPPLNLLLSLTGMNRRTYTLPATGTRLWTITTQR